MRYSIKDYSRTAAAKGWGAGWPACTAKTQTAMVIAPISGVRLVVHKRIARLVYLLVAETERRGYLLRPGQCWGGNCRAIAGTDDPSNHSWWLAVDINSLANAYVKKIAGRPVTDMPAWLALLWNAFGFAWGGDYSGSKADAMHLEFMGSPEDADDMTALAEQRLITNLGSYAPALPEDTLMAAADDILAKLDQLAGTVGAVHYLVVPDGYAGPRAPMLGKLGALEYALIPEDGISSQGEVTKRGRATDVAVAVLTARDTTVRLSDAQVRELATALHPVDAAALATTLADVQDRRARDGDPATGPVS